MSSKRKLPLSEVFACMDGDAKSAYDEWSEEERKELSFWLLNRYASIVEGSRDAKELAVLLTNEYYNKNYMAIAKHPKLQWLTLCGTHNAKRESRRHGWIGQKKAKATPATKFLETIFPNMKEDEVELLARISTKAELKQYVQDLGLEKKDVKF